MSCDSGDRFALHFARLLVHMLFGLAGTNQRQLSVASLARASKPASASAAK
eukprot:COSAG02_NODE_36324_length_456_cov_0.722689_1_plen_50_part_01